MGTRTLITGTGWRNEDGSSRAALIRRHVRVGTPVVLRSDHEVSPEAHGVAVFIRVRRLWGLGGSRYAKIGFVAAGVAAGLTARLDANQHIGGKVESLHAPVEKDQPRVGLILED